MVILRVGTDESWLKMSEMVLSTSKQMSGSEIGFQLLRSSSPKERDTPCY